MEVMVGIGVIVLVIVGARVFVALGVGEIACVGVFEMIATMGICVSVGIPTVGVWVGIIAGKITPIACFTASDFMAYKPNPLSKRTGMTANNSQAGLFLLDFALTGNNSIPPSTSSRGRVDFLSLLSGFEILAADGCCA